MNNENSNICEREHDFALVVGGVPALTREVEDALYESGCDDATLSIQYGQLYIEFSRSAPSLKDAILSAIHDVLKANIGAQVLRVDECDLVTQAEIARRIGRSRQQIYQYINGERGPGGFPPPECHLAEGSPLWEWCAVSWWLSQNAIIRPEDGWNAEVVAAINNWLAAQRQRERHPELVRQIDAIMQAECCGQHSH
jgi:transcriptional regulator with XRE-family HTH domain